MKTLCVLVLISSSLLLRADTQEDVTFGLLNGRFWNSMANAQRIGFLQGLTDGWMLRTTAEDVVKGRTIIAWSGPGFTHGELAEMITSIYADTENVELPIGWVVMASYAVKRGDTTRDAVLMALRRFKAMNRTCNPCGNSDFDPIDTIISLRPK